MVTPEPCVVCDGSGDTMDNCGCCWSACDVCIGSGKRPSPWGWTAALGPENSSEVGTGAKDATGGRRAAENSIADMWTRDAVLAERERIARLVEDVARDWEDTTMLEGVVRRIRAGEP